MKRIEHIRTVVTVLLLSVVIPMNAQEATDSTDIFRQHLQLNAVVVTGLTGDVHLKEVPSPVSVIQSVDLQARASTNIISAIAREPGVSQITTGGAISKPVIRGLGYNRANGWVFNSGFRERAASGMLGLNRQWGFSRLRLSYYHLTPGIIEGEQEGSTGYTPGLPFQQVYHYKAVLDNTIRLGEGRLKAIVGWQLNRRQEFEESADEYELYFLLHTLNYDFRYQRETGGWKYAVGVGGMGQLSRNRGEEYLIPDYRLFDAGVFATASRQLGSNGEHEGTLRYEVGNKDLKPEYSLQGDIGLDFSSKYISGQFALFANRIDNYIFLSKTAEGNPPVFTYTGGNARLFGGEAQLDLHPIHSLHLGTTFSYVNGKQIGGTWLPMIPAPCLLSEIKYEFSHGGKLLNNAFVALELDWNARQDHFYAVDGTETATPAYTLLNMSAGTDIVIKGKKRASLYLLADNLLDTAWQSHLSRLKEVGIYNMGRNFTVKLVIFIG